MKKRSDPEQERIEDHAEAAYKILGMAAYLMLPDPEDRMITLGALLEETIKLMPKGDRRHAAQSVADILLKAFPVPKTTAGLTPEAPIH